MKRYIRSFALLVVGLLLGSLWQEVKAADPKVWFNQLNNANTAVINAVYGAIPSVDHYVGETTIVDDYFALNVNERRTDIVAADVVAAGRILNELKAWLDANDGATGVTRKSRLFKLRGPSL